MHDPVNYKALGLPLAGLLLLVALVGPRYCGGKVEPTAPAAPLSPPAALLGELRIETPNASWQRLQRGVGGAAGILPTTLPGVLVGLVDLDPRLTNELDGTSPIYGAIAGDPADPSILLAIRLVELRRARTAFGVDGGLLPGRRGSTLVTSITDDGFLLVGRRAADLAMAPWVTRQRPPGKDAIALDVPAAALGALVPVLTDAWKNARQFLLAQDQRMRAERGRAPDFGDPAAIVGLLDGWVGRRTSVLADLEGLHVGLETLDDAVVAVATLPPGKGGPAKAWLDPMRVGDAAPVLALPAHALVAVSTRDGDAARAEQATDLESAVKTVLGPRLKDPAPLHEELALVTKARGEALAVALDDGAMLLRAPGGDTTAVNPALRGGFALLQSEPFREALRIRRIQGEGAELVAGAGGRAKLTRGAVGADAGAPTETPLTWTVDAGGFDLAAGDWTAAPGKLADEPALKRFVGALGGDASSILVMQPGRLLGSKSTASLAAALGKKDGAGFVRIELADALVRDVLRAQMGF